ncbi:GNAT family N-acetyltransferase [Pseudalkalibacillus sp. SCS-8]|uniref:GNAT family N-acetyltransferase n=1 Tax=Pseudalkalibacillus nanhaiensis TaxID=3115291 RepID=UPI0032DA8362
MDGKKRIVDLPKLTSKRLMYRAIESEDFPAVTELLADHDVVQYDLGYTVSSMTEATYFIERLIANHPFNWAVFERATNHFIGLTGFRHLDRLSHQSEIGALLAKVYWKQGYGQEMLTTIMDFGFHTLSLNRLYARVIEENAPANRILQRNDFKLEGTLRKAIFQKERYSNINLYAMLKEEYEAPSK